MVMIILKKKNYFIYKVFKKNKKIKFLQDLPILLSNNKNLK